MQNTQTQKFAQMYKSNYWVKKAKKQIPITLCLLMCVFLLGTQSTLQRSHIHLHKHYIQRKRLRLLWAWRINGVMDLHSRL